MNTGSASLTFCCSSSAICARSCSSVAFELLHLGALAEVGAHRARRWSASARTPPRPGSRPAVPPTRTAARTAVPPTPRWIRGSSPPATSASRLWASAASRLGLRRAAARVARGLAASGDRPRAAPASPGLPGLPGRDAGDRRFGSGRFASGTGYLASTEKRGNARSPAYRAASPSVSSMRSSWLYLATRSLRAGAPVLI